VSLDGESEGSQRGQERASKTLLDGGWAWVAMHRLVCQHHEGRWRPCLSGSGQARAALSKPVLSKGCSVAGAWARTRRSWPMFHARSVIQHLNSTEREGGGPLDYPANHFTIRNRGSGHLTGAWKWMTFFAHFHSEPLQVSVPANLLLMLFLPADHVPTFGNWY